MIMIKSTIKGILKMKIKYLKIPILVKKINVPRNLFVVPRKRYWIDCWTPVYHNGRGPYISIGLGAYAIYRGY